MKMKVAKIFAQIVCYVDHRGAVPLNDLKGRSSYSYCLYLLGTNKARPAGQSIMNESFGIIRLRVLYATYKL
jgi:hypothetical protein